MIEYRSASSPILRTVTSSGAGAGSETPTLYGHFAAFNQWTEIDSTFEGNFMERVAPGAFASTLAHDRNRLRVLFQHGKDPQIGNKVLGIPSVLREDELGAEYEVPLLDTSYNHDLIPGLRAGAYGASFRFKVIRENLDNTAPASSYNPKGLPERTITEAKVMEFGPVTFAAYDGATAGVRSLTDLFLEQAVAA
jgi:HK97 family phage prohead protease